MGVGRRGDAIVGVGRIGGGDHPSVKIDNTPNPPADKTGHPKQYG